ncbi:UBX domain-containing protein 4 [Trachymyrmex zeteki]|uniref:UBX domain-containing protein 4 n=1 Tax=Mycetomoellerius zeteki TaxID=64791 RepID=A0A151WYD9_9HYME|nr:PREDICTED: UBX domain-containing protein 4 [Trachymyrmex zeteki]KYQ52920.1 UBX domain-containing protein 4 [Trachymyrmex zeteki]
MKWFAGSINEAVATSKSRKAVFVVFVEGKDDTSLQLAQAIDATEVSSRLEREHFIAIRLESGSETYRFFAQIYQLVPVPSLFFIGENGTPLEIIAGSATASELASKIDNVLTKAGKSNKQSSLNLIDAEQKATATSSSSNNNAVETTSNINDNNSNPNADLTSGTTQSVTPIDSSNNENYVMEDAKSATSLNTENQDNNEASAKISVETKHDNQNKELTSEEKLERARQLIELQRKQRLEEEQKKEREREIERRKMGRDVQKLRQTQQELEIKQANEERRREKAAEAAAREKVRQQIVQDKLERKQKELALQQQVQQQQSQEQPKYNPTPSNATVTRIQFRLPSGNSHTGQFEPSDTLRTLRTYVTENINLPFRHFAMSTSFPRRELTNEENDKTLLELELVPTAVILILPLKNSNTTAVVTSTQDVGFFSRFIWSFFTPVIRIYNYIVGYFSGTNGDTNQSGDSNNDSVETTNNPDRAISSNRRNVVQSSGLFRRYLGNSGGTTIRAQGNIHRLHSGGDDNDENNTWNGNSTQQM